MMSHELQIEGIKYCTFAITIDSAESYFAFTLTT